MRHQTRFASTRLGLQRQRLSTPPIRQNPDVLACVVGVGFLAIVPLTIINATTDDTTTNPAAQVPLLLIAAVSLVMGLLLLSFAGHLPPFVVHAAGCVGTCLVGATAWFHADDTYAVATFAYYTVVAVAAGFISWACATAHIGLAAAITFITMLRHGHHMLIHAVVLTCMLITATVLTGVMVRRAVSPTTDAPTGALTRQGFEEVLATHHDAAPERPGTVAIIDLECPPPQKNRLTTPVSALTHTPPRSMRYCEKYLAETTKAWQDALPPDGSLSRFGQGEFGLFLPDVAPEQASEVVAEMRRHAPEALFSCGVTPWVVGEQPTAAIRRAMTAADEAKRKGRNHTVTASGLQAELFDSLATAVQEGSIAVRFQALVDLPNPGHILGVEALARWPSAPGGYQSPDRFIPVAEAGGLIHDLGHLVTRQSLEQVKSARAATGHDLMLFVNASGFELCHDEYVSVLAQLLERTGFPPDRLVVEVSEGSFAENTEAATVTLKSLRSLGVLVAMDDFGVGQSNLSRLSKLDLDYLKLDRSFLDSTTETDASLLANIHRMGSDLGLPMVVEGVESETQARMLQDLGFAIAQGWLYHTDMSHDELVNWLRPRDN